MVARVCDGKIRPRFDLTDYACGYEIHVVDANTTEDGTQAWVYKCQALSQEEFRATRRAQYKIIFDEEKLVGGSRTNTPIIQRVKLVNFESRLHLGGAQIVKSIIRYYGDVFIEKISNVRKI